MILAGKRIYSLEKSLDKQWQALSFNLNNYRGKTVDFDIIYVTDPHVGGFGFVVDNIKVGTVFFNGAEKSVLTLAGFSWINSDRPLKSLSYYIKL